MKIIIILRVILLMIGLVEAAVETVKYDYDIPTIEFFNFTDDPFQNDQVEMLLK